MAYTSKQLELQAHIEAENAKAKAEMEATSGLWIGLTVSDPEHWASMGIHTVEEYEYTMWREGLYDALAEKFHSKAYARSILQNAKTTDDLKAIDDEYFPSIEHNTLNTECEWELAGF